MKVWRHSEHPAQQSYGLACQTFSLEGSAEAPDLGGMWCELPPGKQSIAHRHHDSEAFLIGSGVARVSSDGRSEIVRAGDIVVLEPFAEHCVENIGSEQVRFVDLWWQNWEAIGHSDRRGRADAKNVLVTATPPTPNGDLHLGHLSGPYLGADVYTRWRRQAGDDAIFVSGADDHQSYVPRCAKGRGQSAREVAADFASRMERTLQRAEMCPDVFSRPSQSAYHTRYVREFFSRLYQEGKLNVRTRDSLFCETCQLHLFEAHVRGRCPHCGASSDGCACEACARPNDCADLLEPRCRYCDQAPAMRKVERLYFPLADYAERLAEFHVSVDMSPHMRAMCAAMLADGLPEIAVSHLTDWGIPFPAPGFEEHKIYVWAEMLPGYFAEVQEALDARGNKQSWREMWSSDDWDIVQFFGFDNGYFHAVLFPALLMAYDSALKLPKAFVVNEFMLLDGEKFSTSRGHAIWGSELLDRLPASYMRLQLAKLRPESEQNDFRLGQCADSLSTGVLGDLAGWLDAYEQRRHQELALGASEPGAWTSDHRAFHTSLLAAHAQVERAYRAEAFSLSAISGELAKVVQMSSRFAARHGHERTSPALAAERRTSLALEVFALQILSHAMEPISPGLGRALHPFAGQTEHDLLTFAPSGSALRALSLPEEEALRRWIASPAGSAIREERAP